MGMFSICSAFYTHKWVIHNNFTSYVGQNETHVDTLENASMTADIVSLRTPRSDSGTFRVERDAVDDPIAEKFINVWRNKARDLGLSISIASDFLGVSNSTLHRVLQGKSSSIPYALVIKFAELMKEPIQTFMPNEQSQKKDSDESPSLLELEYAASFLAEKNGTDPKVAAAHIRLISGLINKAREISGLHPDSPAYEDAYNFLSREALATRFLES